MNTTGINSPCLQEVYYYSWWCVCKYSRSPTYSLTMTLYFSVRSPFNLCTVAFYPRHIPSILKQTFNIMVYASRAVPCRAVPRLCRVPEPHLVCTIVSYWALIVVETTSSLLSLFQAKTTCKSFANRNPSAINLNHSFSLYITGLGSVPQ